MNIKQRLTTNWYQYIINNKYYLFILTLASIFDGITTALATELYGATGEAHLAIRVVCYVFGPILGSIIGKLCQIIAFIVITKIFDRWTWILCIIASVAYIIGGFMNLRLVF